jgi:hypothetical protein
MRGKLRTDRMAGKAWPVRGQDQPVRGVHQTARGDTPLNGPLILATPW